MLTAKIAIGLGVLAVGGTGTYLTYDYLSRKSSDSNEEKSSSLTPPAQSPDEVSPVLPKPAESDEESCSDGDEECQEQEDTCVTGEKSPCPERDQHH